MLNAFAWQDVSAIKRMLQTQMALDRTPGLVVLIDSPELGLHHFAMGQAALSPTPKAMKINNHFRVASISKTYLSVMILMQADLGKIQLDGPITDYLPADVDLSFLEHPEAITVRQLLNMSSGIPEYYSLAVDRYLAQHPYKYWKPKDALAFASRRQIRFEPGKGYHYSNTNYVLLQMILKQVTGNHLATSLRTMICQPLGLHETYADDFKLSPWLLDTHGHDTDKSSAKVVGMDDGFGIGDTFVVTNASELHRFLQALFVEKRLLSDDMLSQMTIPNGYGSYALGVQVHQLPGWGNVYSHNGLVNGFQTNYFYLPDQRLTLIILTNNRATTVIEPLLIKTLQLQEAESGTQAGTDMGTEAKAEPGVEARD